MEAAPSAMADFVSRELGGERILWTGKPRLRAYAWKDGPGTLIFGIPFLAFAIFWTYGAATVPPKGQFPSPFFPLFGIPFILIGLSLLFSPLFSALEARGTWYVITEKRVAIFRKLWSSEVRSFPALGFLGYERISREDGAGSIVLQRSYEQGSKGRVHEKRSGLIAISDTAAAERALNEMVELQRRV